MLGIPSHDKKKLCRWIGRVCHDGRDPFSAYQGPDRVKAMQAILARIRAPQFPDRAFDIVKYGAVAGAQKDASDSIAKAIDACAKAGGGRVVCRVASSSPDPSI